MPVNRAVGERTSTLFDQSDMVDLLTIPAGVELTFVRVTAKLVEQEEFGVSAAPISGDGSACLHVIATGTTPTSYVNSSRDGSILAFRSNSPDGLERIVWAPNPGTAHISASLINTVEWRGRMPITQNMDVWWEWNHTIPAAQFGPFEYFISIEAWWGS